LNFHDLIKNLGILAPLFSSDQILYFETLYRGKHAHAKKVAGENFFHTSDPIRHQTPSGIQTSDTRCQSAPDSCLEILPEVQNKCDTEY